MKKYDNKKVFLWVLKIFIIWRTALFAFAILGQNLLTFKESFPYLYKLTPYGSPLLWSWANFDGVHYLGIVYEGYYAKFTQAFFPLYPLIIRFLDPIFRNFIIDGLFVSNLGALITLFMFYKLVLLDYSEKIAKKSLIFLLIFPTSFFLGAFYNESIFLAFVLSSFYFSRQKKWFLAGLLGIGATLTRFVGIVLIPSLLMEAFLIKGNLRKKLIPVLLSLIPVLGLLGYMYYLQTDMGDPLFFVHAQTAFKVSRTTEKIVLLYQVFYRYIKMLLTVDIHQWLYFSVVFEFFTGLLFLALLIFAYIKKIRSSYLLYGALVYLIPTFTGTLSSMPRYVLTIFPCFIALSLIKNKWIVGILITVFVLVLILSTMLFTRGYWVA